MTSRAPASCGQIALADNTIGTEEIAAVEAVLRSRWLSTGAVTRAFEEEFAAALAVTGAVAVSSGTAALHLAVLAMDLRPGDEVIMPSLSFVAAAAVVSLHGGVPVFADVISPDEPTISPGEVRRLLSPRTRAVVVMHYGGYPARVPGIAALAREHNIVVLEDAAHAPVVWNGSGFLGTVGDIGCFSFHATKNVTTGEGGMVVARDAEILNRVRLMRSHHISRSTWERARIGVGYDVAGLGLNYRPTEISSAIGRVQLKRLGQDRVRRDELVQRYRSLLLGLDGPCAIEVPFARYDGDTARHLMAVLLPAGADREAVRASMLAAGVQTSVHYPPTHLLSYYRARCHPQAPGLPVCEGLADRLLSLPLHGRMTGDDVGRVVAALRQALWRGARPAARGGT